MLTSPLRRAIVAAGAAPVLALTLSSPSFGSATEPSPSSTRTFTATSLTPSDRVTSDKAASSRLARTPDALLKRTDSALVNVMIKYDYDATASYAGGVRNLKATSPGVTGRKLTGKSTEERAYTAYQEGRERTISAAVRKAAPSATLGASYRVVYGGVSATLPANKIKDIVKVDGVVAVMPDELHQLQTDASSDFINATGLQNELGGANGPSDAGKGVFYGNLDSGVWPEHPSFAEQLNLDPRPGPALTCSFGDNPLTPANDPFACNNKLVGGRPFLTTYLSDAARAAAEPYHTARDSNGHGTHTSSTTAGNVLATASVFGVDRGPVRGIAPGAWLAEYKVCGIQGCFGSDSAAAVAQAILDGVDVINFSISGGTDPFSDPVELAFLDAYAAGVFVSTSAGNDGPGASTANHLSPWVTTVAASTQTRQFATTLHLAGAGGSPLANLDGASITAGTGATPLPIVLSSAPPYSRPLCDAPAPAGLFTGKIVACQRGPGRIMKGFNVTQGGAAGMVLYNATLAEALTDNHFLPTVHLPDGTSFLAFMAANPGATAQFDAGEKRTGQGDAMAAFSSRGPAGKWLKPDVTAPGVQILAGTTPTPDAISGGPAGQYFQAIAGTSMSSPHVAGAAVLIQAAHPTWTPGQVKSALMASSKTSVVKENLTTPADPFDMGAGRINVGAAADVALTLDESAANFAALGATDLTAIHLNLPSINAPTMPGAVMTKRTVKNVSSVKQSITVTTSTHADSRIKVSPDQFTLNPGASREVTVNITSSSPLGSQRFGSIVFTPKAGAALHLPVAFVHKQSAVSLTQSCTPTSIARGGTSTCTVTATNGSPAPVDLTLDTTVNKRLTVSGASAPAVVTGTRSVRATATLAPEAPGIPAVAPGELFGYLPLDAFGTTPVAMGDEDIVNFNVPVFSYAGRTWNRIGVDSNGYLVVGGGTSADNNCCNLPGGPSAAAPNNVLAPFWSDLDGTGAPGVFATVLTDGVADWLVIEHRVNVFGTASLRTFQTWIGLNGTQDITFAYNPTALPADPAGQPFLVGAENILGQGQFLPVGNLPTQDLRVTSSPGASAESVSYTIDVLGDSKGTGVVETGMKAPTLLGTTFVRSEVAVN